MLTLDSYNQLNNSFSRKVVFHIGCDGGFFSEYNNMILVMLYCLMNKIKFTMYSKDANFRYRNGWTDYFRPFCPENLNSLHSFFNMRSPHDYILFKEAMNLFKKIDGNTYLTSDVFNPARNIDPKANIQIPELGIDDQLQNVCQKFIELTWHYNPIVDRAVKLLISSLKLPDQYLGFHIRGGDKFIEAKLQGVEDYIRKATEVSSLKTAFVLTDDYNVIETLNKHFPDWKFYTLCNLDETGYFHQQFKKESILKKRTKLLNLFASIDVITRSEAFIGTFSSNPGMFLGMRMNPDKIFSIDVPEWTIW